MAWSTASWIVAVPLAATSTGRRQNSGTTSRKSGSGVPGGRFRTWAGAGSTGVMNGGDSIEVGAPSPSIGNELQRHWGRCPFEGGPFDQNPYVHNSNATHIITIVTEWTLIISDIPPGAPPIYFPATCFWLKPQVFRVPQTLKFAVVRRLRVSCALCLWC